MKVEQVSVNHGHKISLLRWIDQLEITLYSKLACPGCEQIKNYLNAAKANFSTVTAGVDVTTEQMQRDVYEATGHKLTTVPFVLIDGEVLGGLDKFMPWFRDHKDELQNLTANYGLDFGDLEL